MSTFGTKEKIDDLKERHETIAKGGGDKAIATQHEKRENDRPGEN